MSPTITTAKLTERRHRIIREALATPGERIGPWVPENVFYDLRACGYANDSGWITAAGKAAVGA